ncbi:restriction endonuclease subunit S [Confluentibacter sediminis]|uniref:restriction endonuclease subunit S n=1 Tax=Confluentibacter sediminis TaxID=2219045 RepID=UPI000DAD321D|nr:restriction endonuclease subunit S [Confluentibacter sediminis]
MRSNYKKLGQFIREVNIRNTDLSVEKLLGVSIKKVLMPSIANTVGTNMATYKIIKRNQFAYGPVTSRNGDKISIALLEDSDVAIVSQAYIVFEVIDEDELMPEYAMMWFRRPEFDRYARFKSHGSARETFDWDELCDTELPIPSIEKQREIVSEYNTITKRIILNEQLNQKLEEAAQALYKHWFVDFEFPNEEGKPYKSSSGDMVWCDELDKEIPVGWETNKIENIANLKYGKMLSSELFLDKGYPVYSGYGLRGYYDKYMYESPQILVICRGVSGTGEVRMSPQYSYITNLSIVVENYQELTTKEFLYYYLKNDNLRSLDSGSAQSQITTGDLGFYKVLIPTLYIQELFTVKISKIYSLLNIDKTSNLEEFRELLLAKMTKV